MPLRQMRGGRPGWRPTEIQTIKSRFEDTHDEHYANQKTGPANESRPAAASPLDVVPDEMPFDVPYGRPISLARAQAVIQAAHSPKGRAAKLEDEPRRCRFGGNFVAFQRMDGAMLASNSR